METFLGRTGHLDLAKTEGPTGYYGSRVDHGVRGFQKDNALKVDGLINPGGPTIVALRERLDAALVTGRGLDPCLGLWLDARAATERVLAIGREIEAKKDERRDLEAQIEALDSGSPGTYAPTPSLRRPSPGGRSRGARWRDAVGAIGEASGLGADLQGADEYVGEAQARREAIASARGRITSLNGEIAALERDENAALAEERRTGDIYDRCRQENR